MAPARTVSTVTAAATPATNPTRYHEAFATGRPAEQQQDRHDDVDGQDRHDDGEREDVTDDGSHDSGPLPASGKRSVRIGPHGGDPEMPGLETRRSTVGRIRFLAEWRNRLERPGRRSVHSIPGT